MNTEFAFAFLSAVSIPDNSDETIMALANSFAHESEKWAPEQTREFLDLLAIGMSTPDPYRAGIVAWLAGCLFEVGSSTDRAITGVLHWLERTVASAGNLGERI